MKNYFSSKKLSCQCSCGIFNMSITLLDKMNWVRNQYGKPIYENSGCRCPKHNKKVGGSKTSSHITTIKKKCKAMDFKIPHGKIKEYKILIQFLIQFNSRKRYKLFDYFCGETLPKYKLLILLFLQFNRIGINIKKKFIHVDIDSQKSQKVLWFYK